MTVTAVTLGGAAFEAFEIPDVLAFGVEQMLSVHKIIGGQRIVDAMGRDDQPLTWSGRFVGSDALSRALQVKAMTVAGAAVALTFSQMSYSVVIKSFTPHFQAEFLIPFDITCEVVSDTAAPTTTPTSPSLDDQMFDDVSTSTLLSDAVGDPTLSGQVSDLSTAVSAVPSFTNSAQAVLAGVLAPLGAAQGQVSSLIGVAESVLGADLGSDPVTIGANIMAQVGAAAVLPNLYGLGSVLSRMASNIGAAGQGGSSQTMVGGDLTFVAAKVYGDASGWTAIARANGLTDPVLHGVNTLTIPPTSDGADGVLIQ